MIKGTIPATTRTLQRRTVDNWGSGAFGAPRGSRRHKGIDFAAPPGTVIHATVNGTVTKLGYPYGDDLSFRYVEVTSATNLRHRFFYVEPLATLGQYVRVGDDIGTVQDTTVRYEGITNHVHYEILKPGGDPINPDEHHAST